MVRAGDWQVFFIAVIVVAGGGYALIFVPSVSSDTRLAIAGFIGAIISYFFGRSTANNAAATTARYVNGNGSNSAAGPITADHVTVAAEKATIATPPQA